MLLFEGTFTSFFKGKMSKRCHKTVESGFSYYFCLVIEGSGSIPLTNGFGSGSSRPKNTWIRWIRIRIRSTATYHVNLDKTVLKNLLYLLPAPTWAVSVGVGGGGSGGGRSPGTTAQHALQLNTIQPPQLYKCLISVVVVNQDPVDLWLTGLLDSDP